MKHLALTLFGAFLILTFTGCEQMQFRSYSGQNQAWQTGSSFTDKVYEVPVFRGWPEKQYTVLGYIEFNMAGVEWNEGDVKDASKKARAVGGDAILILAKNDMSSPAIAKMHQDLGCPSDRTVAVVLKWK